MAKSRDTAFMMLAAYEQYRIAKASVSTTVTINDLTPYMNYLTVDSTTIIDSYNGATTDNCATVNYKCLKLANGGMISFQTTESFGGSNTTNAIYYKFDPNGQQTDNTTNGSGKALVIWLQYDGMQHSWGTSQLQSAPQLSRIMPPLAMILFGLQAFK